MDQWNNIVNIGLLGTGRKLPSQQDFHGDLQAPAQQILNNTATDKEEQFLQLTALSFGYQQSGIQAIKANVTPPPACKPEVKPYCSATAIAVLKQVQDIDSIPLLQLWLEYCSAHQVLVPPALLPTLLDKAWKYKVLRSLVAATGGQRAEWLGQLNNDWNFSRVVETPREKWEDGSTTQRIEILKELRASDPVTALNWLQETWDKDTGRVKADFLKAIEPTLQETDTEWLETLLKEKSKLVTDLVQQHLKQLPNSSFHARYRDIIATAIKVEGNNVTIALPPVEEAVFKSGINELSNDKKMSDETYVLLQLIGLVHPSYWEQYLGKSIPDVIKFFKEQKALQPFLPALTQATAWFKYTPWAAVIMQNSEVCPIDILRMLPPAEQLVVCEKQFDQQKEAMARFANDIALPWTVSLAQKILEFAATEPYVYNQTYMNNIIHQIPTKVADKLDEIQAPGTWQASYWDNIKTHLHQLLQVKKQVESLSSI